MDEIAHEPLPAELDVPAVGPTTSETIPISAVGDTIGTAAADQFSFDLDNFLENNPFGDLSDAANLDLGGMEQIWDWEDLNLNALPQDGFSA